MEDIPILPRQRSAEEIERLLNEERKKIIGISVESTEYLPPNAEAKVEYLEKMIQQMMKRNHKLETDLQEAQGIKNSSHRTIEINKAKAYLREVSIILDMLK